MRPSVRRDPAEQIFEFMHLDLDSSSSAADLDALRLEARIHLACSLFVASSAEPAEAFRERATRTHVHWLRQECRCASHKI